MQPPLSPWVLGVGGRGGICAAATAPLTFSSPLVFGVVDLCDTNILRGDLLFLSVVLQ